MKHCLSNFCDPLHDHHCAWCLGALQKVSWVKNVAGIQCSRCYVMATLSPNMVIDRDTSEAFIAAHSADDVECKNALRKLGVIIKDSAVPGGERASTQIFRGTWNELCMVLVGCQPGGDISPHGHDTVCSCKNFWPGTGQCHHELYVRTLESNIIQYAMTEKDKKTIQSMVLQVSESRLRKSTVPASAGVTRETIRLEAVKRRQRRLLLAARTVHGKRKSGPVPAADRKQKLESMKHSFEQGTERSLCVAMSQILFLHITPHEVLALDCGIANWMALKLHDASADTVLKTLIRKILNMWKKDSKEEKLQREL